MLREATSQEPFQTLIGVGLYTPQEAGRLTGIPPRSIRRWLYGYARRAGESRRSIKAVWDGGLRPVNGATALSFLDLMEARFVEAFRRHGVAWPVIRRASQGASEALQIDHPFSTRRFRTDGRRIFAEWIEESGEATILDIVRDQYAFHQVISRTLYDGIEYGSSEHPVRWYPTWPRRVVVIDPRRSFGRPILEREGIPTEVLARAAAIEGSEQIAAQSYGVSVSSVKAAIEFEQGRAGEVPARQ